MKKPENAMIAIEGIIKIIILINIIYLFCVFFYTNNFKIFCIVIILTNLGFLFLRECYKKDVGKVEAYLKK